MRTKKIIIILILSNFNIYSQNSNILWVHGLNDERKKDNEINIFDLADSTSKTIYKGKKSSDFSFVYNNLFNPKNVNSNISGIPIYSDQIVKFIYEKKINITNTIFIGYSMGGMAAQYLNTNYGMNFKGIVTLGSFFNGAKIANSLKPKGGGDYGATDFSNTISNMSYNISRGFRAKDGKISYLLNDLIFTVIDLVNVEIGGNIIGQIIGLPVNGKTINDFMTNSSYINNIKYKKSNTPILQIYGVAETPIVEMWLKYFKKEKVLTDLKSKYTDIIKNLKSSPYGAFAISECEFSLDYLNNTMNIDFMHLINDDVTYTKQEYKYWESSTVSECFVEQRRITDKNCGKIFILSFICRIGNTIANIFRCVLNTKFKISIGYKMIPNFGETDGVITKKSAIGEGTNWKGNNLKLDKYNHIELVNIKNNNYNNLNKTEYLRKNIFESLIFSGKLGTAFKP